MGFASKVWKLLVGIKDALVLVFMLLFFTALFAALSARPNPAAVTEGALLLQLDGMLVEEAAAPDPLAVLADGALPMRQYATRDVVRAIDAAAQDDRIKALALDLTTFMGGGQVHMLDVAEAIARFRAAEKPVYTYALAYSDDALLLAANASEAWVDPMGGAAVRGPGGANLYYAGALERFNINARVFRVGTYKSAVEPYLASGMSPESRENAETLYAAVWEEWQANVRRARPDADLAALSSGLPQAVEAAGGDLAKVAVDAGLIDKIGTFTEWGTAIAEVAGEDEWSELPGAFALTDYDTFLADLGPGETDGEAIGVITIAGEINDSMDGPGTAGAARIEALLDDALENDLKALVVRVDSPGGTVTGSETIRRAILRHKDKGIPIVVSMANYAASGGYWLATPADAIFAEPSTLTGSIGVFLVLPTFEDALAEYGVTTDGVRTTALSGQPDLAAGLTPEAAALLQAETEAVYARFLGLVAGARKITTARADELGQGRVWTGGPARQLGLVDRLGGLDDALADAAQRAGLEEGGWHAVYLASPPDPLAEMLAGLAGTPTASNPRSFSAMIADDEAGLAARMLADWDRLLGARGVQARCLECAPAAPAPPRRTGASEQSLLASLASRIFKR
jgi:protease IV